MKKRDFETYQKRFRDFEILPKFSETQIFEVPFATPKSVKHDGEEVSVSLMFLPHFLFAFIRLKQGNKKKYDKMPHNRFLSVQWISLGIFQVRNTTFRLYFSFSSLSYLWTVSPKTFLRPSLAQIRIIAQIIFRTASFS